ncbi:hypothetical protein F4604DRAFT_1914976 [Suillus subluteus]|nr:hypothetical protein F4604DRAFT_1914976 [Suillus subluteus]
MFLLMYFILSTLFIPVDADDLSPDDIAACCGYRTLYSVISSCILTQFACTRTLIHPNIPSPHETTFRVTRRRAGIMLAAVVAPELVTLWAMQQFFHAGNVAKKFNDTLFKEITEDEIEDKSKRDMISKAVLILQITRFLTQYITRYIEHLAITQPEVGTLAFAVLNLIIYCFWPRKPLNVQRPHRVYLKDETCKPQESCNTKERGEEWDTPIYRIFSPFFWHDGRPCRP